MPNLRIIADNAADRATLAASSTAGSLGVDNLKTDRKGQPWRALSTAARLGITWTTSELIGGIFLPFCNLSPTATARVRVSNEAAATNLMAWSENMYQGSTSGADAQRDQLVAPDGSFTMDRLVETTSNSTHFNQRTITLAAATTYTWSMFVRASGRSALKIQNTNLGAYAFVDLASGTISGAGSIGYVSSGIALVGNGIFRVWLTYTSTTGGACWHAKYLLNSVNGSSIYTGDGVSGVYLWGEQVVLGAAPLSYYPSLETFTSRASVGTYFGSNGQLQTAAINVARMQYNLLNLSAPPKLLLEPAATNKLLYSKQFANAAWSKTFGGAALAATVTDNYAIGPDGTMTAARLQLNLNGALTGSDVSYITQLVTSFTGGTASAYLKTNDGTTKSIWFRCSGVQVQISVTGVWQRFSITEAGAGCDRLQLAIYGNSSAQTADLLISDAQLEAGLYATSVITTTSAAVTRSADVATSVAGVRPAGYIDTWQSYDYDSGVVPACPAAAVELRGFTPAQAASAYAYGGGACARHWLPSQMQALGVAIDISDPANLQGYIEAARLVVGEYWSPTNNPDYGASMTVQDASKAYRTDGGDLLTDIGTRSRKMPLSLSAMPPADRTAMLNILRANGTAWPLLISLFPGDSDLELERDHTIYGKLSSVAAMALPNFDRYASTLEIEEV